ncbi:isocitrate lyase/phosphoenolpyruvate mutase family protein, partial [Kitasatospora sp. NPDC127059]|uniref:isocitrate lyase/phosphoenolpyruvate mutase family protein n=1 Tax=Kitasatospora sp. NPDC127059 TaxID=3347120 RepID=UPI00365DFA9B
MTTTPAPTTAFAALHHRPGRPLLLPNAWDHASAAALAAAGHPAIGTTSLGVAAAAGLPDGAAATRAETVRLARRLGRDGFLLSVDVESGFSDDPAEVAALAVELAQAGAVGINLEDGRPDGTLAPSGLHAAKVAAVKAAVPELFVNARTDTYWCGCQDPEPETERRLTVYQEAGADGVFVPGLSESAGGGPRGGGGGPPPVGPRPRPPGGRAPPRHRLDLQRLRRPGREVDGLDRHPGQ